MMKYSRVVASKFDKDSFIGVMPETFGTNSTVGAVELFHSYGFASMPVDMDADGACGMMTDTDAPTCISYLLNDGRIQSKLPEILQGESFQYGPTGNFVRCHKDGRVSLFTTDDATVNGRTVALTVGPTGLVFNAPWGNLKFDATGFHVLHSSGARIDMGACGGLPAPLSALASYATLSAALVHVEGAAVNVGVSSPTAEPAAKANQTVLALQSITTALDAVGAALAAITSIPAASSADPESAAAVSAIILAQSAIVLAATTIPSLAQLVA